MEQSSTECGKSVDTSRECDFGVLPGRFVLNGTFPAWIIFDPRCPLEDRLSGLLQQGQRDSALGVQHVGAERQALKILLFGDSVEQWITRDICSHFTNEADNIMSVKDSHAHYCSGHHWNCASCSTHGFILAREASHGVLTTHDFEQVTVNSTLPLVERIPKVIKEFKDFVGPPDIVSLSLNLWDVQHWGVTSPGDFTERYIPDDKMQLWLDRAEAVFRILKDSTGKEGTTLIVKTTAFPVLKIRSSDDKQRGHSQNDLYMTTLPGRALVAQLNAAQRFLGQRHGFHIVDVEAMLSSLGDVSMYLRDERHTSDWVNHEVLNVYLNLHHHHHQRHVSHTADTGRFKS